MMKVYARADRNGYRPAIDAALFGSAFGLTYPFLEHALPSPVRWGFVVITTWYGLRALGLVLYLHYARYRLRKAPSQAAAAAQLEVADEQMYPAIWKRGGLQ